MVLEHTPVLLDEVLHALAPQDGEVFVDCTLGRGGHAEAILRAAACRVVGIDRDPQALEACRDRLADFGPRFVALRGRFGHLTRHLQSAGVTSVDGILADVGVSSPQLDDPARGFSFRARGPIDMRMDPDAPLRAAEIVNLYDVDELTEILRKYGEERHARRIASAIVAGRPWTDTAALAACVENIAGRGPAKGRGIHPATRTFQALRIVVNEELDELEALLPAAVEALKPGGRMAIIAFHSLEDRIVKQFFAAETGRSQQRDPFGYPVVPPRLSAARRPIRPRDDDPNPRARSARLRTAVRLL